MPPSDITAALVTPYASPLTFRTEVRPHLYLASAGLLILGAIFVGYYVSTAHETGFTGIIAATLGVFMLYVAWVNFWVTRAGYPHLILIGHRLTVQSSDAVRRDLDLGALGQTEIKILTGNKGSQRLYLGFLPAPGATHTPRRFTAPKLQPYAETILLNGYVGTDLSRAKAIQSVIDARRTGPRQEIALPPPRNRTAAQLRLVATASVFAVVWVTLVWTRLLP